MALPMSLQAWNALTAKVCMVKQGLKNALGLRNTLGDRITITEEVLVYEGDRLLFKSRGHIVNQGLTGIVNLMSVNAMGGGFPPSYQWTTVKNMRVGTGVGVTVGTMTSLIIENATAPSSVTGANSSPQVGQYRVAWIATWNAGVLPAIVVTEIGLKLNLSTSLQTFGDSNLNSSANQFFSRLSSSDGDFTAFTVNVAVPLVIEWRLTLTFA